MNPNVVPIRPIGRNSMGRKPAKNIPSVNKNYNLFTIVRFIKFAIMSVTLQNKNFDFHLELITQEEIFFPTNRVKKIIFIFYLIWNFNNSEAVAIYF